MSKITVFRLALALLLAVGPASAVVRAQEIPSVSSPTDGEAQAPPSAEQRARQALLQLLHTLEDPAVRQALLRQLDTVAGSRPASPEESLPEKAVPVDAVRKILADYGEALGRTVRDLARSFREIGFLYFWLKQEWADADRRALWLGVLGHLLLATVLALAAAWYVHRRLERKFPEPATEAEESWRIVLRIVGLRLVRLFVFSLVAFGYISLVPAPALLATAATDLLVGVMVGRTVRALVIAFLSPDDPALRPLPLEDATARDLARAIGLLNAIFVYGTAILRAGYDLGLPWTVHAFLLKLLYLAGTIGFLRLTFRFRQPVAAFFRSAGSRLPSWLARFISAIRLPERWHLLAGGLAVLLYGLFALEIQAGARFLLLAGIRSVLVLIFLWAFLYWFDRRADRWAGTPETTEEPSDRERRWQLYRRLLFHAVRAVVVLGAVLFLLDSWGLGVFAWLASEPGVTIVRSLVGVLVVVAVTLASIETVNAVARHYLEAQTADGRPLYGTRTRTLASILRNLFVVLVGGTGFLVALSQLGVDTGPLLAGAGIVGLAIGLGSQKLVQDLTTGLFILLGDTVRVGDVVSLAGKAGVVEALSMRAVTLRGYDGQVHTVPYSAVDTVSNMTKDFAYWVMDIGVAYREDVDQVMEVLREIDAGMRREWPWRRLMLAPIDIAGVDQFGDSAVIVKARLKTRPGEQWRVGREYQRRMKIRFDELGIEIPFPHRTLYFGVDKEGRAPPLYIRPLDDDPARPTEERPDRPGREPSDRPAED